ncbi:MAG: aminoacyl-histidine dipeptidase [Candidatus Krumholzibacteriota bacterium]|nr:aminoacyl-histidine dipeptidase [Candidatus Krumholzibacteriota bacterium]
MPLTKLEPKYLWSLFDAIRQIPRPSKHEEKIRAYILSWAGEKGFDARTDDVGNVVVRVPGTASHENAPVLVVQSHMDMVCEKNKDVEFDFMNDPIQLERDGDWLTARGTTLGADNGVGLAAAMALAEDPDVVHPPLEILVTVDEETGLTGAGQLSPDLLEGRRLLNLDTEELGAIYIGCAGGGDSNITLQTPEMDTPENFAGLRITVKGLRGGHSGMDIIEQRGNAIKALARILWKAGAGHALNLVSFEGGGVHNAIPREAAADCVVEKKSLDTIATLVRSEAEAIATELGAVEPNFSVEVEAIAERAPVMWDEKTTDILINLLYTIPHGVDTMSNDVPGLVETSNNLASVWTRDGHVVIGTSSRSSLNSAVQAMRDRIRAAATLAGGEVEENNAYPGWKPNTDSELLAIMLATYKQLYGNEPEVKAVHAGLECGIIGEKCPGMDMISFGPIIEAPHSPDERVNIPSVETFWTLLKALVKELA